MNGEPESNRCRFCPSAFGSANDRERHESLAHREELQAMARFECSCGRDFGTEHGSREVHIGRAGGEHSGHYAVDDGSREGVGVVPAQEDIATPEELAAPVFEHCDHVEACAADPSTTDCGADPCNLVDDFVKLHEAEYPQQQEVACVPGECAVDLVDDYRMELIETLADLADRELFISENVDGLKGDFSLVYDALARIKAVARS